MKGIYVFVGLLMIAQSLTAQNGIISGKIFDSSNKKPLPLTTVTVFKAKDTSIVTYRLSNENGDFKIPGLPLNSVLRLIVTFSGYAPVKKEFLLTEKNSEFNAGSLWLSSSTLTLEEIVVLAERPPVIIKNDTIEFNASAFKTLPTALLEDLLRKLPGMEVDEGGNLTVNGRKVNKLLIDGKQFFGNDYRMATRNLPSNIVSKVQVVDDKEELAMNNDGDLSKVGKVINITLKKEIKKAIFGKAALGKGTDGTYEANGILNSFRDTLQVSILGFSNNLNKSSFSLKDVSSLGGFDRSGYNGLAMYGGGGKEGYMINGVPFGGTGSGISTTNGGGINLNHSPSRNFSFYLQAFYGETKNTIVQSQNILRYFGDTVYTTNHMSNGSALLNSNSFSAGTNWKTDSLSNLTFTASYNISKNTSTLPSLTDIATSNTGLLSSTKNLTESSNTTNTYSHNLGFSHRFSSKKGRLISINHNLSYAATPGVNTIASQSIFSYPVYSKIDFNQERQWNSPSTLAGLSINFSEPLSKRLTLRFAERLNYDKNDKQITTFAIPAGGNAYDSIVGALSNRFLREQVRLTQSVTISYRYGNANLNFTPTLLDQWIGNYFIYTSAFNNKQRYSNLLLNASVNWKQSGVSFSQDITAPYINYMSPVPDNSNPLMIVAGNPGLLPTKRKEIYYYSNVYNTRKNLSFSYSILSDWFENYVTQAISLSSSGVQVTTPENASGGISNYLNFKISKQYKSSQKQFATIELSASAIISKMPMIYNSIKTFSYNQSFSPSLRVGLNWHDAIEVNARYYPGITSTKYESESFHNTNIVTQNLLLEAIVRAPEKLVWESNLTYRGVSNVASGFPATNINWNAAVTFLFLKQDKGQLKLAVYDLLNQNSNLLYYVNGNAVYNTNTNILKRYALLTFSYNIRSMRGEKQKVGGRQSIFLF